MRACVHIPLCLGLVACASRQFAQFMHIDVDMYTSTRDIFDQLGSERVAEGCVIVFDEFFCTGADGRSEATAFRDWAETHGRTYEFLMFGEGGHACMLTPPSLGEPAFADKLFTSALFNALAILRQTPNFDTSVAVRITN